MDFEEVLNMAIIVCKMNCKHRSRRPLRKWMGKDGSRLYRCTRETVVISRIFDFDGDILAVAGEENMAHCAFYEPLDGAEGEEDRP